MLSENEQFNKIQTFGSSQGSGVINLKGTSVDKGKLIFGDVYLTDSVSGAGDHWVLQLGSRLCSYAGCSLWNNPGALSPLPTYQPQQVTLAHPGQNDGYTPYYGLWFTSLTIPMKDDSTIVWDCQGGTGGPTGGNFVLWVRGYYAY